MQRRPRLAHPALAVVVACVVAALVAPPAGAGASDNIDGTLVLAHLGPETGDLAPILESLRTPVQIAVEEINAAGGVAGAPVALLTGDEDTDAQTARANTTALLADGTDAIIGPSSSDKTFEILETTKDEALVCSGSNGSAQLTTEGPRLSGGMYFRTSPSDRLHAFALAELILADGNSKVAIIARDDSYGRPFAAGLARALRRGGARVPAVVQYDPASDDLTAAVREALDAEPQAVAVISLVEDGAAVVRALVEQGAPPAELPLYASDGLYSARLPELVDPINPGIVQGIAGTAPAEAPAGVTSPFHDAFAVSGVDPVFSAHYYDCTILTALAAVRAGSDDPRKMARFFASNLKGDSDCNTFATCRDLLEAGETIHWRGASSSFDRFGRFEPREGVYQPWSFDAEGIPNDGDPTAQIKIS